VLNIDIDFNDYWVWAAINSSLYSPRIMVVEYNSHIPPHEARTVVYQHDGGWDGYSNYCGAGVAALAKLGASRGYTLVHCESHGVNCFFVRDDVLIGSATDTMSGHEAQDEQWRRPVDEVYARTNYFGKGWTYPDRTDNPKWVWV
jgi:hypothetical protein